MAVNHDERAYLAWPVLAEIAQTKGATITYGDLAARIGVHPRAIRYVLGLIQSYCLTEGLPPLTILVVYSGRKVPGPGFVAWNTEDLPEGYRRVASHTWNSMLNPFAYAASGDTHESLADSLLADPGRAEDIYARVKVRGTAQIVFRKALLQAYGKCAFCGVTFAPVLQAAHLIPWNDCTPDLRMSPWNGLLLCATHHVMFDAGIMTIDPDFQIVYDEEQGRSKSTADHAISSELEGRRAFMPKDSALAPSVACLKSHHDRMRWDFDEEWSQKGK